MTRTLSQFSAEINEKSAPILVLVISECRDAAIADLMV